MVWIFFCLAFSIGFCFAVSVNFCFAVSVNYWWGVRRSWLIMKRKMGTVFFGVDFGSFCTQWQ